MRRSTYQSLAISGPIWLPSSRLAFLSNAKLATLLQSGCIGPEFEVCAVWQYILMKVIVQEVSSNRYLRKGSAESCGPCPM